MTREVEARGVRSLPEHVPYGGRKMKKPPSDRPSGQDEAAPKGRAGKEPPAIASAIGRELRVMYRQMMDEPVPDHLLDLVARLDSEVEKPEADADKKKK